MMILSLWQQRHSLPLDKKSRAAYSVCPAFKVHMKLAVLSQRFLFGIGPVAGAFAAVDAAEFIPDFHQCKAEHVLAFPVARISCFFVVGGCADAPDGVIRACFHDDVLSCGKEKITQFLVLCEFAPVVVDDNRVLEFVPDVLFQVNDSAAEGLNDSRVVAFKYLFPDFFIAEKVCFSAIMYCSMQLY